MTPDAVNAAFEFVGALLICLSIRRLHRDREVKGVSPWPVAFFASWGFWNLYFYPHVDQWLSFYAGLVMVAANATWLAQMAYYLLRAPRPTVREEALRPYRERYKDYVCPVCGLPGTGFMRCYRGKCPDGR